MKFERAMDLIDLMLLIILLFQTGGVKSLSKSFVIGNAIGKLLDTFQSEFKTKILTMNMNENNTFLEDVQNEILKTTKIPVQIYNFRANEKYEFDLFSYVILSSVETTLFGFFTKIESMRQFVNMSGKFKRRTHTYQRNFVLLYILNSTTNVQTFHSIDTPSHSYFFTLKSVDNNSLVL